MFSIFEDQESRILSTAFARLCRPDAEDSERDELRLLLLELAQRSRPPQPIAAPAALVSSLRVSSVLHVRSAADLNAFEGGCSLVRPWKATLYTRPD